MTNKVLLDNVTHKDLRVRSGYSAEFGDEVNNTPVFPTEFALVQREYPIVFRKHDSGHLQAMALLGLDKDENLFLDNNGWNARYVPAFHRRGPFLIGLPGRDADTQDECGPTIHVDLDDPRITTDDGEAVFLPHGGNSPYLEQVSEALQIIHEGARHAKPMFAAFQDAGLIEEMTIEVQLDDSTHYKIPSFLTINEERLAGLSGSVLEALNRLGYLQLASLVVASLGNVSWLIELKNRRRRAAQA